MKRIISSLSRCDMCGKRNGELFTQGGLDVCKTCNRTLKACDKQRGSGASAPREAAGFLQPRWKKS